MQLTIKELKEVFGCNNQKIHVYITDKGELRSSFYLPKGKTSLIVMRNISLVHALRKAKETLKYGLSEIAAYAAQDQYYLAT